MRELTADEKLKFTEGKIKFCKENRNFIEDVRQVSFLMKGSINFDEGTNILAPNYGNTISDDGKAFVMSNIEAAMKMANIFKENRYLHDCAKEYRDMFVGMCPNTNEKVTGSKLCRWQENYYTCYW